MTIMETILKSVIVGELLWLLGLIAALINLAH